MEQEEFLWKLLRDREKRVYRQQALTELYQASLLCLRVNCPGGQKNTEETRWISALLDQRVREELGESILYREAETTAEGPVVLYCLGVEATEVKLASIEIEETHPLGRLVDLDVYDQHGRALHRRDFGSNARKCFLCSRDAKICAREENHSQKELLDYMREKLRRYLEARREEESLENHHTSIGAGYTKTASQ